MIEQIRKQIMDELNQLQHELEVTLPRQIEIARGHGDLSENADYSAALERRDFCKARMGQLMRRSAMLQDIKEEDIPTGVAGLGSLVTVRDLEDNEEETVELVMSGGESRDASATQVTIGSPFGKALKGHVAGEDVDITLPFGTRKVKILKLQTIHDLLNK